jgi:hypothetical protein
VLHVTIALLELVYGNRDAPSKECHTDCCRTIVLLICHTECCKTTALLELAYGNRDLHVRSGTQTAAGRSTYWS